MKDGKIEQFSIKRPDDRQYAVVQGILVLSQSIIVADSPNTKLKLFELNGVYLSSADLIHSVWGITAVTGNQFATCGIADTKVRLWTLRGQAIVTEGISYDLNNKLRGIHYNGTYYCVLDRPDNAISVLDTQGRRVRKIIRKEAFGMEIDLKFGCDIQSNTQYICAMYVG